ncbi:MAG: elongation factor 1-beta [Nanoarchaeota archaeon]
MAKMFITLKIMPDDQETNLESIKSSVVKIITDFGGSFKEDSLEPVAFGLKALKIMYLIDESKGVDELCELISAVEGVGNVEAVDMRRAVG